MAHLPFKHIKLQSGTPISDRCRRFCYSCIELKPFLALNKCLNCDFTLCSDCMLPYIEHLGKEYTFKLECPTCRDNPMSGIYPPMHIYSVGATILKRIVDIERDYKSMIDTRMNDISKLTSEYERLSIQHDALKQSNVLFTRRYSSMSESSARASERIKELENEVKELKTTNKRKREEKKEKEAKLNKNGAPRRNRRKRQVCDLCSRKKVKDTDCIYCTKVCNICSTPHSVNDIYCPSCSGCFCFTCNIHYNSTMHESCPFCTDTE